MKFLCLSKRHYTGHDLHLDGYGRVHALVSALAAAGNEVRGLSSDYRSPFRGPQQFAWGNGRWTDLGGYRAVAGVAVDTRRWWKTTRFDAIVSFSDALQVVLGDRLARRRGCPHIVDLYDDFEAFGLTRAVPGLRGLYRRALARAHAITCVSRPLAEKIRAQIPDADVLVLGNGVDCDRFRPLPGAQCRHQLGLPPRARLVAIPGGLDNMHGIEQLTSLWELALEDLGDVRLVLAGPRSPDLALPSPGTTIDLGELPHDAMPALYSAADLVLLPNRPGLFGDACYPMKLAEALACQRPLLAARTQSVADVLQNEEAFLFDMGDAKRFSEKLRALLESPRTPSPAQKLSWQDLGQVFTEYVACSLDKGARQPAS